MPKNNIAKPLIRNTPRGAFYVLKSGRKIPVPPSGGVVNRGRIREAISKVSANKK